MLRRLNLENWWKIKKITISTFSRIPPISIKSSIQPWFYEKLLHLPLSKSLICIFGQYGTIFLWGRNFQPRTPRPRFAHYFSWIFHDIFMTFSWLFHDFFMTFYIITTRSLLHRKLWERAKYHFAENHALNMKNTRPTRCALKIHEKLQTQQMRARPRAHLE